MSWLRRERRHAPIALLIFCSVLGLPARATAARLAILVGNDEGQSGDAHLRYAESDATRFQTLLTRIGGFLSDSTVLQVGRTANELRQTIASVAARLNSMPGEHLVLLYYSGHADSQALHMGNSTFPLAELQEALSALPAAARVLILDACHAGVLTRAKGGHAGAGFEASLENGHPTRGLAILASSAGAELAQESDQLGASVFTHYIQVGLAGLADRNQDGVVSLGEAFDYASERTLATTIGTTTGPQHPTFRLDISGRDDLILTRPGRRGVGYGQIRLNVPGWYFIRRGDGTVAAEVVSKGAETLAVDPGSYEVTRREERGLDIATLSVAEGQSAAISDAPSFPIAFGRMVRKGGGPEAAYGLAVATSVRTPIADLGPTLGLAAAARADLSALSFEVRVGLGRAKQDAQRLSSTTWETRLSLAALRVHDFGTGARRRLPTLAVGLEAGVSYLAQQFDDGERRSSWNPFLGPSTVIELMVGRRFCLRADLGVPVYLLRIQESDKPSTVLRPALFSSLGAGGWF